MIKLQITKRGVIKKWKMLGYELSKNEKDYVEFKRGDVIFKFCNPGVPFFSKIDEYSDNVFITLPELKLANEFFIAWRWGDECFEEKGWEAAPSEKYVDEKFENDVIEIETNKEIIKEIENLGYIYKRGKLETFFMFEKYNNGNQIVICIDTKYQKISKHYKYNYSYVDFTFEEFELISKFIKEKK